MLVKLLIPQQIESLKKCFERYDTDFSGYIEVEEVIDAIKHANYDISPEEIENIINELDFNDEKKINYSEFIAASMNTAEYLTDQKL